MSRPSLPPVTTRWEFNRHVQVIYTRCLVARCVNPFRKVGRGNEQQYWWQGPQSPFSEGAAQNQGVVSGGRPGGQTVVGCSGDGCSSPLFSGPAVAASSSSSSSSGGGSCCNHYWQKPGHPCSTHQGNDCPRGFNCVNYRSCSNGIISHGANSGYTSQKPSLDEVNLIHYYV